uniref:Uncharacterized protein n=1 Tax=Rhizophora mucronata TaxID=61149 RepID=A0A2P2N493_RHIMU
MFLQGVNLEHTKGSLFRDKKDNRLEFHQLKSQQIKC